ncbi:hypothetical protein ACWCQW_26400 [Streptomyces mirabilis]
MTAVFDGNSDADNDHEGAADCRALVVCLPSWTQVSSHIRERHWSMGIAVPVCRGRK